MFLDNSTFLITGGTGTFGQAFTRYVLSSAPPQKLILFSRDEWKQQQMRHEFPYDQVRFFLGDVRDLDRLHRAFAGVDVVIHAAALKQVLSCEYNPLETIKTNIYGTQNVIEAALSCGVKKVLLISSDKAVQPINLYGATKMCAEKMMVQANMYARGRRPAFSVVRYGNVWGSRGSVGEVWEKEAPTGTLTLTDPQATRFWWTADEASQFVRESIFLMQGGEIFVPHLFSSTLEEKARALYPSHRLQGVGLGPGEKKHECLISAAESDYTVWRGDRYVIYPADARLRREWAGNRVPENWEYTSKNGQRRESLQDRAAV